MISNQMLEPDGGRRHNSRDRSGKEMKTATKHNETNNIQPDELG